jgi:hypothetical protein
LPFLLCMQGMDAADPRLGALRSPASILQSPGRLPPRGPNMNCMKFYLSDLFVSVLIFKYLRFLGKRDSCVRCS